MEVQRLGNMMDKMSCRKKEPPKLSDYIFCRALGQGAYGVVYHVRGKDDKRDYALKQIEMPANHEGIPQTVLRELAIMKTLSRKHHPNLMGLKAVFHNMLKDKPYVQVNMILEKCDWDLYSFLRDIPKGLPEYQCQNIAVQLLRGLDFLHSHNIVHRDLKPQNILLNRDQSVKIADFGLSRAFSNTSAFTTLVVTLWYRSPEILLQTYYDSATDMWAAGCIIYEVFKRDSLLQGQTEAEQLRIIFQKIGTPSEVEWPGDAIVPRSAFQDYPPLPITSFISGMSCNAADLIFNCLRFCRFKRLSASQALRHPWLAPHQPRRVLRSLNHNQNFFR